MFKEGTETNCTPIKNYIGHSRQRFQRTVSRSNSSISCKGSQSKDIHHQKSDVSAGTYIKRQKTVQDEENRTSRIYQDKTCEKNEQKTSKVSVLERKHILDYGDQGDSKDSRRNAKNPSNRNNLSGIANGSELKMLQGQLQKESSLKKQLEKQHFLVKQKYAEKHTQCERLEKALKEKDRQIRKMTFHIESLEVDREETNSLWKSIDILEMEKIKKDQQIREMMLFRQTDEKTILRLTDEISQIRQLKSTPKKLLNLDSMETLNQSVLESGSMSIYHLEGQLSHKQQEISKLQEEIKSLNLKNSNAQKKFAEQKRKLTHEYQRKFAGLSGNYRNAQRQLGVFQKQDRRSQELQFSLSPQN